MVILPLKIKGYHSPKISGHHSLQNQGLSLPQNPAKMSFHRHEDRIFSHGMTIDKDGINSANVIQCRLFYRAIDSSFPWSMVQSID